MSGEINDLEALSDEIRKIISDNEKFLSRVMDEDFEPDEEEADEEEILTEL
ncbi:MAG TPA: hypothetical protein VI298_09085 [Geobacteraceae bacterium]